MDALIVKDCSSLYRKKKLVAILVMILSLIISTDLYICESKQKIHTI